MLPRPPLLPKVARGWEQGGLGAVPQVLGETGASASSDLGAPTLVLLVFPDEA